MRLPTPPALFVALALAAGAGAARAQDLYRLPGAWVDEAAQPYALERLYGRATVLTMAYGACRQVCSTSLRMMEQLQALADERGLELNFVVVGLDPAQDRPSDWAAYRAAHRLERANWHFLSGSADATRRLARRLGVRAWRYGDHLMHDLRIVLLSPQAQPLRTISSFDERLETLLQ